MTKQRLVITSEKGMLFLLVEEGKLTLGGERNPAETVVENLRIHRVHCELEVEGDHVAVSTSLSEQEPTAPREWPRGEVIHSSNCDLRLEPVEAGGRQPSGQPAPEGWRPSASTWKDQPAAAPDKDEVPALQDMDRIPKEAPPPPMGQGEITSALPGVRKRFLVVDGADQGRQFPLVGDGAICIGKDRKYAEIILNDLYVAHIHCQIRLEGDQVTVIEEEGGRGAGGMLVNGQKVASGTLQVGDVLRVGNSHLRLEIDTGEDSADSGAEIPVAGDEEPVLGVADDEADGDGEDSGIDLAGEEEDLDDSDEVPESVRLLQAGRQRLAQLAGQAFGHFRLNKLLGRGRSGVVFQALDVKDVQNSQIVALKVLAPPFPPSDQELQRFARVVKAILPLRHPNLVTLYTAGKTGSNIWISREYVEGESVAEILHG